MAGIFDPDPNEWITLASEQIKQSKAFGNLEGDALKSFLDLQTELITSLPLEAARYAQELAMEAVLKNDPAGLVDKIERLGDITRNRAVLIARTEVSRTASGITQLKAEGEGSKGYIWRTQRDDRVREAHRRLEGRFIAWNKPPQAGGGLVYHAGQGPGCRCYMEVVFSRKDRS